MRAAPWRSWRSASSTVTRWNCARPAPTPWRRWMRSRRCSQAARPARPAARASPARPVAVPAEETDGAWRGVTRESRAGGGPGAAAQRVRRSQCPSRARGRRPSTRPSSAPARPCAPRSSGAQPPPAGRPGATSPRRIWSCSMTRSSSPRRAPASRRAGAPALPGARRCAPARAALEALPDARLRERADDLLDLETQVLLALQGRAAGALPPLPPDAILIARELLPSQLAELARCAPRRHLHGRRRSDLARRDSGRGHGRSRRWSRSVRGCWRSPTAPRWCWMPIAARSRWPPQPARLEEVRAALSARAARRAALTAAAQQPGRTADGTRIEVFANVGSVAEAEAAVAQRRRGLRPAAHRVPVPRPRTGADRGRAARPPTSASPRRSAAGRW